MRRLQGQLCLPAGTVLGAAEIGILATVGATRVAVVRAPTVAVLSTGDEVVDPACAALGPGQIRDCNRSMLVAAAKDAGARVIDLGIAKDQVPRPLTAAFAVPPPPKHARYCTEFTQNLCSESVWMQDGDLEGCVQRALDSGADVIVSSGGVSMGTRDLIKPLLERAGQVHCGRVLMKPGKPLTFATMDLAEGRRVLFFGLPGTPPPPPPRPCAVVGLPCAQLHFMLFVCRYCVITQQ